MGLFDKFFKKGNSNDNTSHLTRTTQMLDEDLYWKIVSESLEKTSNQDEQEQFLIRRLQKLTPTEIIGFRLRTDKLLYDTYNAEMWCAGYIMNGGCSDDGFEYFRNWVISRGKEVYYNAKNDPDTLIDQVDKENDMYDFESFWYVALEAFINITGKDLYDFVDDDNFKSNEAHYPTIDFSWKENDPDTMKLICPKLFESMWH